MRKARIEQELSGFILFGGLMDEPLRRLTAELLYLHLYDPNFQALPKLLQSRIPELYPNWHRILLRLLDEEDLRHLTRNNEDFAFSVARETLAWCKKTYHQFKVSHPYQEEEKRFSSLSREADTESWMETLGQLDAWYPERAQAWSFYRKALAGPDHPGEREILEQNLLEEWRHGLARKVQAVEDAFLEEHFSGYASQLDSKVAKLQTLGELLAPVYNFIGHVWSDHLGSWNRLSWQHLEAYAQTLQRDSSLRELAELLGRWSSSRQAYEERRLLGPSVKETWRPERYGKSEITGIHQSDDLSAMIPSEIALLSTPETETLFALKYVEKKLLTFQYRSQGKRAEVQQESRLRRTTVDERGPFIVVMDTSGSMFGGPERMAKALALAVLELALRQQRRAYLISFSTGISTFEMTGMEQDLTRMVEFLRMSFHGGTDLQPALRETLDVLEREAYRYADVLVISDFILPRIDRELSDRVEVLRKSRGVSFHSLYVTRRPDSRTLPLPIFDNHWIYDLDQPGLARQAVDHFEILAQAQAARVKRRSA